MLFYKKCSWLWCWNCHNHCPPNFTNVYSEENVDTFGHWGWWPLAMVTRRPLCLLKEKGKDSNRQLWVIGHSWNHLVPYRIMLWTGLQNYPSQTKERSVVKGFNLNTENNLTHSYRDALWVLGHYLPLDYLILLWTSLQNYCKVMRNAVA